MVVVMCSEDCQAPIFFDGELTEFMAGLDGTDCGMCGAVLEVEQA